MFSTECIMASLVVGILVVVLIVWATKAISAWSERERVQREWFAVNPRESQIEEGLKSFLDEAFQQRPTGDEALLKEQLKLTFARGVVDPELEVFEAYNHFIASTDSWITDVKSKARRYLSSSSEVLEHRLRLKALGPEGNEWEAGLDNT